MALCPRPKKLFGTLNHLQLGYMHISQEGTCSKTIEQEMAMILNCH